MAIEKNLYPSVERWLSKRYDCVDTFVNRGLSYGRIDVSGVRHIGGHLTGEAEFVAVEVKTDREPFGTAVGQASGYSVYADRCYLAAVRDADGFTADEVMIADNLGVGLLHLRRRGRGAQVEERQSAPRRHPIPHLRAQYLDNLGYVFCALCRSVFYRGDGRTDSWNANIARQKLSEAVAEEKGYVWWLSRLATRLGREDDLTYYRRYLCADCIEAMFVEPMA